MANLVELYDLVIQAQSFNGVPLSHGHVYVYALGRTKLMDTWSDIDGESLNTNPVILDNAGQAHIYVSDDFDYTLVFTDEYDNEVFSVDKYLLSKGEHSHADVAVAPSEHIGVSSYHVGEVTVYVPYLTGEVGKTYEGIDPIVVNNTLNRISANHIPLGVQDPLYFVEDSETACIIGMSGGIVPEGVMTESALGFENNKITGYNGSAFSAGNEYEAGSYISIDNNTISVTGLQPEGDYAYNSALSSKLDVTATGQFLTGLPEDLVYTADITGLATTAQLNEKLDKSDSGNFYPMEGNPSGYLTGLPSDLATTGWVDSQGYLTAVDIPESAVWNATTQTVSANSAQWAGGTANPQIPVTSTSGISIFESGDKVYFNISADYATKDWVTGQGYLTAETDWTNTITAASANAYNEATAAIPAPFDPSYISAQVDTKLDSAIYANDSGTFLTAHQSLAGYATENWVTSQGYLTAETDWSDTITAASANAYNEATAQIPTGLATEDWVTAQGYLTAHQDLSDYQTIADMVNYQTTAGMTAYQSAGDYLTTADSGNFLTAVPDTYLQNTDLSTEDGKVTAISGIPLSAGGDVPEGVMVESGLEYNAVNEISAYNGSAIAQYGAEKQWLVHDDTLVHAANSAQYALGVNLSAVAQLLGVDETVLWSGETLVTTSKNIINLSESMYNFNSIKIYDRSFSNNSTDAYAATITEVSMLPSSQEIGTSDTWVDFYQMTASGSHYFGRNYYSGNADGTKLVTLGSYIKSVNSTAAYSYRGVGKIFKIVGVHRISG